MEPHIIPEETSDFAKDLFRERGIEFLYDLSIAIERILIKEIEKYSSDKLRLPNSNAYVQGIQLDDIDIESLWEEERENVRKAHKAFHNQYVGYEEVKSKRNQIQKKRHQSTEKELSNRINKLTFEELLTLAYNKSEKNFGYDLLSFIYFQVKELAKMHNIHLDSSQTIYLHSPTGVANTKTVLDKVIIFNRRISTLGILEYVLEKAIKEIEDENEAKWLLQSSDD